MNHSLFRVGPGLLVLGLLSFSAAVVRAEAPPPAPAPAPTAPPATAKDAAATPTATAKAETPAPKADAKVDAAAPATPEAKTEAASAATPATPPAAVKPAPPPPPPEAVVKFDEATALFKKKKYDEAWKKLDQLPTLAGYSPELANMTRVRRAEILMWRKKPDQDAARALVLRVLHEDREGKLFADAIPLVQSMADDLRHNHPFIFHEPLPFSRPGRPLKLKAKAGETEDTIAVVKLHFRGSAYTEYSETRMTRDLTGWSFLLREPQSLAPADVTDEYGIDYYLTAEDSSGKVVDMDGSPEEPITTTLSSTKVLAQEEAAGIDLNAVSRAENAPPVVAPPPPPETPWYLQWYTLTAGGVVVVGAVTAIVLAATRPHAALPADRLGTITFPLVQK